MPLQPPNGQRRSLGRPEVEMKKRIIVLGSTGSIGQSALDVLRGLRAEWDVVGLAAGNRWELLADQATEFGVAAVAIGDSSHATGLADRLGSSADVRSGNSAMLELIEAVECDCVVCGVVGTAALRSTVRAVELGRRVALANKEALVTAGSVLMPLAKRSGAEIIPVDSEHSAIFQAMHAGRAEDVHKIFLTASGGPFRTWSADRIAAATINDALRHPTWEMGPKITIDSATMMNKALEIVEARWLFDLDAEQIDVVVHPESIIHSLVEFRDGSMIAQLSQPDMRMPIQYALTWPARLGCPGERLDLSSVGSLTLEPTDEARFPALRLGHEVARRGGTCGAVLNAANEQAVDLFRKGSISFSDITALAERSLADHTVVDDPTLDELLEADAWAREEVLRCTTC